MGYAPPPLSLRPEMIGVNWDDHFEVEVLRESDCVNVRIVRRTSDQGKEHLRKVEKSKNVYPPSRFLWLLGSTYYRRVEKIKCKYQNITDKKNQIVEHSKLIAPEKRTFKRPPIPPKPPKKP